MKLIPILLAVAMLTGCAPDTSEAWGNCIRAVSSTYRLEHGITDDDPRYAESLEAAGEVCSAQRDRDPGQFAELWS